MIKEEIDSVKIEHRGGYGDGCYWNITMMVQPLPGNSGRVPCYADMVEAAEGILRQAKGLGRKWHASTAEVMGWSSDCGAEGRGILTPHRYRVTLDMVELDMADKLGDEVA